MQCESAELMRELARGALEECQRGEYRNASWLKVYFGMAGERDTPETYGTSWEQIADWCAAAT